RNTPARTRFLSIEPLLEDLGDIDLGGIDWVIVGGESGAGARPMEKEWVEAVRRSCEVAHTRFFFKQWGGVRKGKHGRTLDGRTYDEMPALQHVTFHRRRSGSTSPGGLRTLQRGGRMHR
ncbi:MAG: phage Gp37/Gp68 family protein, partial [Acidobacteriota bacterium]|nr:phage Gp37/Gp68 family protein [Acidobacteriota bacterium]